MRQTEMKLRYSGWGGKREGAGRKRDPRSGIPHLRRERFAARHPCHVTLRVRRDVPSLRDRRLVRELEKSFGAGCERGEFRLVHYSLQRDHAHLIVEAKGPEALGRGMKSLGARLARAVNRVFQRRGAVLEDRYHARALRTPREVRAALRYVLLNRNHHAPARRRAGAVDPASSARWFDGWRVPAVLPDGPAPVVRAHSWLLLVGWRRRGLLDRGEVPG